MFLYWEIEIDFVDLLYSLNHMYSDLKGKSIQLQNCVADLTQIGNALL